VHRPAVSVFGFLILGTYQETHGIISKEIYDPLYNEDFKHTFDDIKWWNNTEPIWHTASKHDLKSASVQWPGGLVKYYRSNFYNSYDLSHSSSLRHKLSHGIKKFINDEYVFIAMHDNQLDLVSHKNGIDSVEFNNTIRELDSNLGGFVGELKARGLYNATDFNTIILSTHGMVQITKNIFFDRLIDKNQAKIISYTSTLIHLTPLIPPDELMAKLARIPYLDAYLKGDVPDRWYYKNNRRVGDILVVAKEGISLQLSSNVDSSLLNKDLTDEEINDLYAALLNKADHGYDNDLDSMKGVFFAKGSAFKSGYASPHGLDNVDVYPLMCRILDLACNPNNGSFEKVQVFLRSGSTALLFPSQPFKDMFLFCLYCFMYIIYF
jgi:ectonucleotide pyrophosphatase/phosphodiesterase family protein 5